MADSQQNPTSQSTNQNGGQNPETLTFNGIPLKVEMVNGVPVMVLPVSGIPPEILAQAQAMQQQVAQNPVDSIAPSLPQEQPKEVLEQTSIIENEVSSESFVSENAKAEASNSFDEGLSSGEDWEEKTHPRKLHEGPVEEVKETFSEWFYRKFGGTGFMVSMIFHAILIITALLWISSRYMQPVEEPDSFVTGSGGGKNGERPSMAEHSLRKRPKTESKDRPKITSKATSSSIVLPEMNMNVPTTRTSVANAFGNGEASSGAGGGKGGGIGTGTGIGVGNGRNFIGKFAPRKVMGADVYADKIAVYLDCSGSMTPYLPRVKQEIYDKFPDADIFEFNAIVTWVIDGEVVGGKSAMKGSKRNREQGSGIGNMNDTDTSKLSKKGAAIYKKYADNFERGSVGAWLDIMAGEGYDALVVFSDFQDGVRQFDANNRTIYADSRYQPMATDDRKAKDLRWEKQWRRAFQGKRAPKLYLFTIECEPQKLLTECVKISDGKITNVEYLRGGVQGGYPGGGVRRGGIQGGSPQGDPQGNSEDGEEK